MKLKTLSQYLNIMLIVIFCVIPVLLWLNYNYSATTSFNNFSNIFKSLGQIFAIIGATIFCIDFIFSARIKIVERIFGGLGKVYSWHHYMGAIALILLLFHPLFLGTQYLFYSLKLSYQFFFPQLNNYFMWFGIVSLTIMIILLIITFYIKSKMNYNTWKFTHKFLGLSLTFAFLHIIFSKGEISANLPLHIYLISFGIIGLICFFYKTIFSRLLIRNNIYTVSQVTAKGNDITEITLIPKQEKIKYKPGQFIFIKVISLGIKKEEHPFSILSAPSEPFIKIGAKSLGDYTETLKLIKQGSIVKIEGPHGRFNYENTKNTKQIWIAGGIGITPFISMAKSLPNNGKYYIDLYYVVSTKEEAVYYQDLNNIKLTNPSLRIIPFVTKDRGHLNAAQIVTYTPDINERDIFLCGPPAMMNTLKMQFKTIGVSKKQIHSEEFNLL